VTKSTNGLSLRFQGCTCYPSRQCATAFLTHSRPDKKRRFSRFFLGVSGPQTRFPIVGLNDLFRNSCLLGWHYLKHHGVRTKHCINFFWWLISWWKRNLNRRCCELLINIPTGCKQTVQRPLSDRKDGTNTGDDMRVWDLTYLNKRSGNLASVLGASKFSQLPCRPYG
jgi:hypothetical protein